MGTLKDLNNTMYMSEGLWYRIDVHLWSRAELQLLCNMITVVNLLVI